MGAEAVAEELVKAGADVNANKCDGVTPLHDAVASGSYQVRGDKPASPGGVCRRGGSCFTDGWGPR